MRAALLALLLSAGCGWPGLVTAAAVPAAVHPSPTREQIDAVALRADELRIDSLGLGSLRDAGEVVLGPAAALLRRNHLRTQRLQAHLETVVDARTVVHWSVATGEATAVVATAGRQRLLGAQSASPWDNFADQWQYTIRWNGGWRVWSALDLAPEEWWPA
jgi:hypothetical protein